MIVEAVKEHVFNECNGSVNAFGPAFFDKHLAVVVAYAGRLAEELGADPEIVELAGWLHDISAIQDFSVLARHPAVSAEIARKILQDRGYPSERIERVAACILSHSSPVQVGGGLIEEVCVSNADAMSQIVRHAYWCYYVFRVRRFEFTEGRDWLRQRVEDNWASLIQPARDMIEAQYRRVREVLTA
ncbi:MAG: HD domain-containing protein [Sedimentisphaerales bacterium]|nr:HD domain-containing protein [Sedimentisphaerales bacterium]